MLLIRAGRCRLLCYHGDSGSRLEKLQRPLRGNVKGPVFLGQPCFGRKCWLPRALSSLARTQPSLLSRPPQNGNTALAIAKRLGYISVVDTLKVVTEEVTTTTTVSDGRRLRPRVLVFKPRTFPLTKCFGLTVLNSFW